MTYFSSTRPRGAERTREILRELGWSGAAVVMLAVRIVATLTTPVLVIAWVVVAVRSDLANVWLWPAIASSLALLAGTIGYSAVNSR